LPDRKNKNWKKILATRKIEFFSCQIFWARKLLVSNKNLQNGFDKYHRNHYLCPVRNTYNTKGHKMSKTIQDLWYEVSEVLEEAKGIAFDGCHKIYVALDNEQVHQMASYGYGDEGSHLITSMTLTPSEMLSTIEDWYAQSCGLRFVEGVRTVAEGQDPNEGFTSLIPQGFGDFDYEDED